MFYELRKPVYFSCNVNMAKTAITKYCIMVYKMIYCRSMVFAAHLIHHQTSLHISDRIQELR